MTKIFVHKKRKKICMRTVNYGDIETLYQDVQNNFFKVCYGKVTEMTREEAFEFCKDAGSRDTCEDYFPDLMWFAFFSSQSLKKAKVKGIVPVTYKELRNLCKGLTLPEFKEYLIELRLECNRIGNLERKKC